MAGRLRISAGDAIRHGRDTVPVTIGQTNGSVTDDVPP
jgi:hypothetical protein